MDIRIPTSLIFSDPVIAEMAKLVTAVSPKAVKYFGSYNMYGLDNDGEMYITKDQINYLLSVGAEITGYSLYTPVIPRITLDNNVPAEFGAWGRTKADPNYVLTGEEGEVIPQVTKEWQEFTRVFDYGIDQCCLQIGERDITTTAWKATSLTSELLQAYITEFGGYMTKAEFVAWKAANEPVSGI